MNAREICVLSVLALGLFGACSDGIDLPEPARMEKVGSGDLQPATAGNRLSIPLAVLITASDGSGVAREAVRWTVEEGVGAVLSDSITVTDGTGLAQVYLTLGPAAGTYLVRAVLVRKEDAVVTFSADAVSAPIVEGVTPVAFGGGVWRGPRSTGGAGAAVGLAGGASSTNQSSRSRLASSPAR